MSIKPYRILILSDNAEFSEKISRTFAPDKNDFARNIDVIHLDRQVGDLEKYPLHEHDIVLIDGQLLLMDDVKNWLGELRDNSKVILAVLLTGAENSIVGEIILALRNFHFQGKIDYILIDNYSGDLIYMIVRDYIGTMIVSQDSD